MSFCLLLLAYAVGLVAPGYCGARLLGGRSPRAVAVPLSLLYLFTGVLLFDALGWSLRFGPMLAWELVGTGVLAVAAWKWRPPMFLPPDPPEPAGTVDGSGGIGRWLDRGLIAGLGLMGVVAITRGFMAPLTGYDVPFRWEFLSLEVLQHQSLAFYPPVTPADFHIYFHPDGFAPIVSMGYWWIYAALGQVSQAALVPLVLAQYFGTIALAAAAARHLHSRRAALLAAAILAATPLFFRATLIGQETGLTALAMTGMVAALLQVRGPDDRRGLILAGLLAGVAGLAREYGPALAACGALVLLWRRLGWRALAWFGVVAALVILPWNLRNWLHTGNPLYGHLAGLFPVNPVFNQELDFYHGIFGFQTYDRAAWLALGAQLVREAGWPLLVGGAAAILLARRQGYLAGGAAAVVTLWLLSVAYTSGGVEYSMRALSPALALLSIAAAVALARLPRTPGWRWLAAAVGGGLGLSLLSTAVVAAVFPLPSRQLTWAQWAAALQAPYHYGYAEQGLAPVLPQALPPGTRILTENAYAHRAITVAGANYDLVPVWSPEVAFLLDPKLDGAEQHRRLLERNITAMFYYPNSPNTAFLQAQSAFYAQDSGNWQQVATYGNVFIILRLKPPTSLNLRSFSP